MRPRDYSDRRQFIKSAAAMTGLAIIGTSTAGCENNAHDRTLTFATLDDALTEMKRLAAAPALSSSSAAWSWAQTLNHCAQSIEFSITGYPQAQSALFQRTIGAAAFAVFAWRGRMTHDVAEPIPGAPALDTPADPQAAQERLQLAIEAFNFWPGPLQPHFAYGMLTKQEYEQAHAMHLANHFSLFQLPA